MSRYLFAAVLSGSLGVAGAAAAATTYTINSGTTQVNTAVTPFSSTATGVDFYNYSSFIADPAFDLSGNTLHIYLHETIGTSNVSVGYIFNTANTAETNSGGSFTGTISGALASAQPGVEDDAADSFGWRATDTLDGATTVNGDFGLTWVQNFTDGFTIETTSDQGWTINLDGSALSGITNFTFLSGDIVNPTALIFENPTTTTFSITAAPAAVVPVPPALALLGGGLMCLGWMRRRAS